MIFTLTLNLRKKKRRSFYGILKFRIVLESETLVDFEDGSLPNGWNPL